MDCDPIGHAQSIAGQKPASSAPTQVPDASPDAVPPSPVALPASFEVSVPPPVDDELELHATRRNTVNAAAATGLKWKLVMTSDGIMSVATEQKRAAPQRFERFRETFAGASSVRAPIRRARVDPPRGFGVPIPLRRSAHSLRRRGRRGRVVLRGGRSHERYARAHHEAAEGGDEPALREPSNVRHRTFAHVAREVEAHTERPKAASSASVVMSACMWRPRRIGIARDGCTASCHFRTSRAEDGLIPRRGPFPSTSDSY